MTEIDPTDISKMGVNDICEGNVGLTLFHLARFGRDLF